MAEPVQKVRCAVYTRKSTEDGLDQEFNSLDAQREACCAYVVSQRHEGWTLVPDLYDDGGFSGGNMERPALKRLLNDVAAGKIDVILIYKIDRLTRSLADFSKIVDVLDRANASFVSITQSFNTTTSMGRLTLNMLLSFAQFEREVTGERIRDKIAASKRKGLWMGGPVPLGYDVVDRKLVVNVVEAELVRHIMRRYLEVDSVRDLVIELERDGYRTKIQHRTSGPQRGGCLFSRGTLYHLLKNRIYLGEIVHKGVAHPGEHDAIVDAKLWGRVQDTIATRAAGPSRRQTRNPSLLTGIIFDPDGHPMTPTQAKKGSRRYRYYTTRPDQRGGQNAWRVPAFDLETIVTDRIIALVVDQHRLRDLIVASGGDTAMIQRGIQAGRSVEAVLRDGSSPDRRRLIRSLVSRVMLMRDSVSIDVSATGLFAELGLDLALPTEPLNLVCSAVRVRQGHEIRLVIPSATTVTTRSGRDEKLIALLAEAQAARDLVLAHAGLSMNALAMREGRCRSRLRRLFELSHIAPSIAADIVNGRHPQSLNHRTLLRAELPIEWTAQRALLGFCPASTRSLCE